MAEKQRMLSGMRPTGRLHLGHQRVIGLHYAIPMIRSTSQLTGTLSLPSLMTPGIYGIIKEKSLLTGSPQVLTRKNAISSTNQISKSMQSCICSFR